MYDLMFDLPWKLPKRSLVFIKRAQPKFKSEVETLE